MRAFAFRVLLCFASLRLCEKKNGARRTAGGHWWRWRTSRGSAKDITLAKAQRRKGEHWQFASWREVSSPFRAHRGLGLFGTLCVYGALRQFSVLHATDATIVFTDVTAKAGIHFVHNAGRS